MRHVSFALAWCVASAVATAAPPQVPQTLTAKSGKLLRVVVKTDAEIGTAKNFTEEQAFWGELIAPKGERHFVFQGPTDNETDLAFVVAWWTVGEKEGVTTTITVPGVKKPAPPVVDPVKPVDPPKPDKPAPAEVYYFAVVGAAGPVLPAVATSLKLPAWDELRKAGHVVNYVPVNELSDGLPRPGMLPVVMMLKRDGSKWVDTGSNKPLPTTDEQIRSLIK
jgi:hypothetical protein